MAGISFNLGETKKRPGVYTRYEKEVSPLFAGASDGIVACALQSDWGPLAQVVSVASVAEARAAFGSADNTSIFEQIFIGGASTVLAVRVGSDGTKASVTLKDSGNANAVTVQAKYPGSRTFTFLLRTSPDDAAKKEFILYESGRVLESFSFAAGTDEHTTLVTAGTASDYVTFAAVSGYSGTGTLTAVTQTSLGTGTQPTVDDDDYQDAFALLEPFQWNCICLDSSDTDLLSDIAAFMQSAYAAGHTGFCVIGEPVSVALATRKTHAAAFNSYLCVYTGGGFKNVSGDTIDGWLAAARVAGMIASVSSAYSLTHRTVSGAVTPAEMLTNAQYESCIDSGMLTFSCSPSDSVWIESAITTLVSPSAQDDDGWRKVKRAKIRFELMERIYATVNPLIGGVSNDEDGRAAVIQSGQRVLLAMIAEGKLQKGALIHEDDDNPPSGDSAHFVIEADDIDALEKVYFTYTFSFAQSA